MKTTLVFTLLVCCLCLGAKAEDAKLNDGSSTIKARKHQLGMPELKTTKRKLTFVPMNTCEPVQAVIEGYRFEGTNETVLEASTLFGCSLFCRLEADDCAAYNFDTVKLNCTIVTSVTELTKAEGWSTSLVEYEGGDPCLDANIIREFHQAGSDYKIFTPGEVLTPEACCQKCVADQAAGCVAWDYQSESEKCYLKKTNPPMKPATRPGLLYTGYGCATAAVVPRVVV